MGGPQGPFEAPGENEAFAPPAAPPPGQGALGAQATQGAQGGHRGQQTEQNGENPFADPKDDAEREQGRGLQAPLIPMNYGLPPESVTTPAGGTEQAERPRQRYRF